MGYRAFSYGNEAVSLGTIPWLMKSSISIGSDNVGKGIRNIVKRIKL